MALRERPDVALVDVKMPAGGGAHAAREIRKGSPQTRVVALSAYEDRRTVLEMLRAGVVGYLVQGSSADEILYAIRRSMRGQGQPVGGGDGRRAPRAGDPAGSLGGAHARPQGAEPNEAPADRDLVPRAVHTHHDDPGLRADGGHPRQDASIDEARDLGTGVAKASERLRRLVGNLAAAARLDLSPPD